MGDGRFYRICWQLIFPISMNEPEPEHVYGFLQILVRHTLQSLPEELLESTDHELN